MLIQYFLVFKNYDKNLFSTKWYTITLFQESEVIFEQKAASRTDW